MTNARPQGMKNTLNNIQGHVLLMYDNRLSLAGMLKDFDVFDPTGKIKNYYANPHTADIIKRYNEAVGEVDDYEINAGVLVDILDEFNEPLDNYKHWISKGKIHVPKKPFKIPDVKDKLFVNKVSDNYDAYVFLNHQIKRGELEGLFELVNKGKKVYVIESELSNVKIGSMVKYMGFANEKIEVSKNKYIIKLN